MIPTSRLLLAAGGLSLAAAGADAATVSAFLYADQGTDEVRLTRDLNGDGDANDPGETQRFFGEGNAGGLTGASTNVFTLTQAGNGAVYVGDGGSDTVYRLRDLNGNDDAQDSGEAGVWFSAGNAGGLPLLTPNGIAEGGDGAIYVVEADVRSTPNGDYVYRTQDLNGDGDADDAGEANVWLDLKALNPSASAFEISFDGDVAYITDTVGTDTNVVYRAEDVDGDGSVSAGEVTRFIDGDNPFGIPVDFAMDARDGSVFLWEFLDTAGAMSVFELTDGDGSGLIDAASEIVEVWNSTLLPAGIEAFAGFSLTAPDDGSLLFTSNGGDAAQDNLFRLVDLDGDGAFFGDGETQTWLARSVEGTYPDRPRAVAGYSSIAPAPVPLPAGLPLLATALLAGGVLARRKADRG